MFDQELAQCIESESLGSSQSSPTAQYHQYSSGANSHSVAQLANFSDVLASNETDSASLAAVVGSINGNGVAGLSNGVTGATNGLSAASNLLSNGANVNQGASNYWTNLDISKNNGPPNLLSNSQLAQSYQSGASSIIGFNKSNGLNQAILSEQLRNSQLKAAISLHTNSAVGGNQVNGHMNAVRPPLPQQQLQVSQQQVTTSAI